MHRVRTLPCCICIPQGFHARKNGHQVMINDWMSVKVLAAGETGKKILFKLYGRGQDVA
jgi:hypothetical protein